jgi:hypothetical protein
MPSFENQVQTAGRSCAETRTPFTTAKGSGLAVRVRGTIRGRHRTFQFAPVFRVARVMGGNLAEIRRSRAKEIAGIDPDCGCVSPPFAGEFGGNGIAAARGTRKDFRRAGASLGAESGVVACRGKKMASRAGSQEACRWQDSSEAETAGAARVRTRRLEAKKSFLQLRLQKARDEARLATHGGLVGRIRKQHAIFGGKARVEHPGVSDGGSDCGDPRRMNERKSDQLDEHG